MICNQQKDEIIFDPLRFNEKYEMINQTPEGARITKILKFCALRELRVR